MIRFRNRVTSAEQLRDEVRELIDRDGRVIREREMAARAETQRLNGEARARREARAAERERAIEAQRERERLAAEAELREHHRTAYLTANPTATDADFDAAWETIRADLFRERAEHAREIVVAAAIETGAYRDLV